MSRVVFGPEVLARVVMARKRFRCGGHLAEQPHYVEPGERYVASALPPHSDVGNTGWWHARICMDCCPTEYADEVQP